MQFNVGDTYQIHTFVINDDTDCEDMPNEKFYSNIALNSRVLPINVINSQSTVTIDDSEEAECSELFFLHVYNNYSNIILKSFQTQLKQDLSSQHTQLLRDWDL